MKTDTTSAMEKRKLCRRPTEIRNFEGLFMDCVFSMELFWNGTDMDRLDGTVNTHLICLI
jgi:hypothetical protein